MICDAAIDKLAKKNRDREESKKRQVMINNDICPFCGNDLMVIPDNVGKPVMGWRRACSIHGVLATGFIHIS